MPEERPLRGDVYWANLEPVTGSEQGGYRPVFIMSNNLMNQKAPIIIVIPITRAGEQVKQYPFNIPFDAKDWNISAHAIREITDLGFSFAGQGGYILCNQARAISKERLLVKMGNFTSDSYLKRVENAIIDAFGLNICKACEMPLRPNSLSCANPKCRKVHSKKCNCSRIYPMSYLYCPECGRRGR